MVSSSKNCSTPTCNRGAYMPLFAIDFALREQVLNPITSTLLILFAKSMSPMFLSTLLLFQFKLPLLFGIPLLFADLSMLDLRFLLLKLECVL